MDGEMKRGRGHIGGEKSGEKGGTSDALDVGPGRNRSGNEPGKTQSEDMRRQESAAGVGA